MISVSKWGLLVAACVVLRAVSHQLSAVSVDNQPASPGLKAPPVLEPAVRAVEFESRKIYQSKQRPSYTSWFRSSRGSRGSGT